MISSNRALPRRGREPRRGQPAAPELRRRRRHRGSLLRLIAGAAAVASLLAPVALGKGPAGATIEGPGLASPLRLLGDGEGGGSAAMAALTSEGGFFPAMFGMGEAPDPRLQQSRPAGLLGPRYAVVYDVPGPNGSTDRVRQDLYPHAARGPVLYTPPGQPFFDGLQTRGGWYQAPATLRTALVRAGIPTSGSGPPSAGDSWRRWTALLGGGLVALLALVAGLRHWRARPATA